MKFSGLFFAKNKNVTQTKREKVYLFFFFFTLMFDVLLIEASFRMCYYIHAELCFDMSLSKGPGFLSIALYRAVINSVIEVSVAEKFLSWSSASALSVFDWHQFPLIIRKGCWLCVAFGEHSTSCTIDRDQKAKPCFDRHKINELALIGVKKPHILHMFRGETQP